MSDIDIRYENGYWVAYINNRRWEDSDDLSELLKTMSEQTDEIISEINKDQP